MLFDSDQIGELIWDLGFGISDLLAHQPIQA
jgi:hypothetical protein